MDFSAVKLYFFLKILNLLIIGDKMDFLDFFQYVVSKF